MIVIHSQEEWNHIVNIHPKIVIDCYTEWCGPCKKIANVFETLSEEFKEIHFIKVDVDKFQSDIENLFTSIQSVPTFLFVFNGKLQSELTVVGANIETLTKTIQMFNLCE